MTSNIKITIKQEKPIVNIISKTNNPVIRVENNGKPGIKGDSAFVIAVNNGFVGTEIEWLESLKSNYKTYICGEVGGIGGHRAVYLLDNDIIKYCTNTDFNIAKKLIGITTQASNYLDNQIVQKYGEITDNSFNFDLDLPIYLGENGLITQVYPVNTCIILGFPLSLNKMYINIQQPIILS